MDNLLEDWVKGVEKWNSLQNERQKVIFGDYVPRPKRYHIAA